MEETRFFKSDSEETRLAILCIDNGLDHSIESVAGNCYKLTVEGGAVFHFKNGEITTITSKEEGVGAYSAVRGFLKKLGVKYETYLDKNTVLIKTQFVADTVTFFFNTVDGSFKRKEWKKEERRNDNQ